MLMILRPVNWFLVRAMSSVVAVATALLGVATSAHIPVESALIVPVPLLSIWLCLCQMSGSTAQRSISMWRHFSTLSAMPYTPPLQYDLLGEDVLITGAGPIGAMAAAVCKHAGARHVVITDINPQRLELAKRLGATCTVDVRTEKLEEVQRELGMSEGFDVGLEMSGNPSMHSEILLASMCHGGKVAILGIPAEETGD